MSRVLIYVFGLLIFVSSLGFGQENPEGEKKEIDYFSGAAKREWRKQREEKISQIREETIKNNSTEALQRRALGFISNKLYGSERCFHSADIAQYLSASDLKSYDIFAANDATEDNPGAIYAAERRKIEDKLLKNNTITRRKDLEKELDAKYKLCGDREVVEVEDIRGKKYKGPYRKEYTTEKIVKIGIYSLSRFDLTLESRARFWQKDHKDFVNKEVKKRTRQNTFVADETSENELDGKVQQLYLEAGFIPNFMLEDKYIYQPEPKYWISRAKYVEAFIVKTREDYYAARMRGSFTQMNIGDGNELVPHEVAKAYREKQAKEKQQQ